MSVWFSIVLVGSLTLTTCLGSLFGGLLDEDKEGEVPVDIKTFEDQEERTGSDNQKKEDMLAVGAACVLQGLFDSSKNGQECTILKLPGQGDDGRCVVQMSSCRSKLAVKLPNLRPLRGEDETEIEYSARVLGLTAASLRLSGCDGLGKGPEVAPQVDAKEILVAALRSAQRFARGPRCVAGIATGI